MKLCSIRLPIQCQYDAVPRIEYVFKDFSYVKLYAGDPRYSEHEELQEKKSDRTESTIKRTVIKNGNLQIIVLYMLSKG